MLVLPKELSITGGSNINISASSQESADKVGPCPLHANDMDLRKQNGGLLYFGISKNRISWLANFFNMNLANPWSL